MLGKERPPSPIIEMVAAPRDPPPSTYQFPARTQYSGPMYGMARPHPPAHDTIAGITYPAYGAPRPPCPMQGLYPSLPQRPGHYVSMLPPQLTTPRGPMPGSLPRPRGSLARYPGPGVPEYGVYSSPRGVLSRVPSLEQHRPHPPDLVDGGHYSLLPAPQPVYSHAAGLQHSVLGPQRSQSNTNVPTNMGLPVNSTHQPPTSGPSPPPPDPPTSNGHSPEGPKSEPEERGGKEETTAVLPKTPVLRKVSLAVTND